MHFPFSPTAGVCVRPFNHYFLDTPPKRHTIGVEPGRAHPQMSTSSVPSLSARHLEEAGRRALARSLVRCPAYSPTRDRRAPRI